MIFGETFLRQSHWPTKEDICYAMQDFDGSKVDRVYVRAWHKPEGSGYKNIGYVIVVEGRR